MKGSGGQGEGMHRYFPSPMEQSILMQNIHRYFQYPERSIDRNAVAKEVSAALMKISSHWTHRTVRLWFNNNRNSFGSSLPPPVTQPDPPTHTVTFGEAPAISPPQPKIQPQYQPAPQVIPQAQEIKPNTNPDIQPYQYHSELLEVMNTIQSAADQTIRFYISRFNQAIQELKSRDLIEDLKFPQDRNRCILFPDPPLECPSFSEMSDDSKSIDGNHPISKLYQKRASSDFPAHPFDTTYINDAGAYFIHNSTLTPDRVLSFCNPSNLGNWQTVKLNTQSRFEFLVADTINHFAWGFGRCQIHRMRLDSSNKKPCITKIPNVHDTMNPCSLVLHHDSVVLGFNSSKILYYLDHKMKITSIETDIGDNKGFSIIASANNGLLAGLMDDPCLRFLSENGKEAGCFLGHTETVISISFISDMSFVTASDDRSLKIWDLRQRIPVAHVGTNHKSIIGLTSSDNHVIFSTHDKTIRVVDIRAPIKSIFGVATDEYSITSMHYSREKDTLGLFGIATKYGNNDSLLFVDDEGGSHKYIYRQYNNFIHC